ncbi:MAG: hypothetical protein K5756_10035 [Clostridiales bacterium]|nr:hypothetical protein [Clostridiales bacterium]
MSKFFSKLLDEGLFSDWAETLDWLFDDLKFSKEHRDWNGGYVSSYTKKIKKELNDPQRVICERINPKNYPNQKKINNKLKKPYVMMNMSEKDSFARDLVRHIRNGIAHGESKVRMGTGKAGKELFIEIIDYSDKAKKPNNQTAYLFIPLSYIVFFQKTYSEMNRSIMNTKAKDRKASQKLKKERRKAS